MWQSELIGCVLPSWSKCYSYLITSITDSAECDLCAKLPRFIIPFMPVIFQRGHPLLSVSVVLRLAYPHQHPIRSFLFSLPRLSKHADSFNFLLAADQTESARRAEDGVRGVGRARLSKYEPLVFSQDISALKPCLSSNAERRLILAS